MVFPVVMYCCESWTIKKAERQRIGAFELWTWANSGRWWGTGGACCSPQEHEESDMTWWLNNNKVWSERMTLGRPLTSADSWPVSHSCWIRTLGVTQNPVFISYLVWFWVYVSLLKKKKLIHKPFEGSCGTLFTFVSIISKQHHTYSRDWIQLH